MRPVLHGDLIALARVLLRVPEAGRVRLCHEVLASAAWADAYRAALGRAHPDWGDGSVMAAAARHPQAREPFLSDPDYLHCLRIVVSVLLDRALGHARRRKTRSPGLSG